MEITDRFQQPDFLVYKIIQDVFLKLFNQNNWLHDDIDETDFNLGEL